VVDVLEEVGEGAQDDEVVVVVEKAEGGNPQAKSKENMARNVDSKGMTV
jgi:hypothetical protein